MAAITQIIEVESNNADRIHLFREGLFLKAHQRSAFLFLRNVKDYKVLKKHYKATGTDVVLLGFPSTLLSNLVDSEKVEQIDEWHFCIPCSEPLNEKEYQAWFDSIPLTQEKPRKKKESPELFEDQLPSAMTVRVYEPMPQALGIVQESVLKKLESFSIENSTPMECMMFLSKLKSELKKGESGGL